MALLLRRRPDPERLLWILLVRPLGFSANALAHLLISPGGRRT